MRNFFGVLCFGFFVLLSSAAEASFTVADIRVEGLQRISPGSVFAALPINVGDTVDEGQLQEAIRSLFYTGNFDNVSLLQDGDVFKIGNLQFETMHTPGHTPEHLSFLLTTKTMAR